jgi:tetratricopeptide (TPR) repeat protein
MVALLRGRQIAQFRPVAEQFGSEALATAWTPSRECELIPITDIPSGEWWLPAGGDAYLQGLVALSAGERDVAQRQLSRAVEEDGHILALALLANMQLQSGKSLPQAVDAIGPVTSERREEAQLGLARYYLGVAARCDAQGEAPAALRYLAIGEALLPAEGIAELDLHLARRIGEIYLAGGQVNEALPWLRHASQANDSALLLLADTLDKAGLREEALAAYQRTLLYYPERAENRVAGARMAGDLGEIELAITILAGMPDWADLGVSGLQLWAQLCEQQADKACAISQYERVLSLEPGNQTAQARLQALNSEQ